MTNLTNYHSHTTYCDGKATAETFIQEAIRQGFYSYGISSHAPLPFHTHWSMDMEDTDAYIREITHLKAKYAGQIEVYLGMEIDYLTDDHNPSSSFFQKLPLDYRIGSVHLLHDREGNLTDIDVKPERFAELIETRFNKDLKQVVTAYFDKLMTMLEKGGFDFVGHADKISMNASYCQPDITSQPWYLDKIRTYFSMIAAGGYMMEINTKAFKNKGLFFPNREHFTLIRDLRIPVLVNSDSHQISFMNDGRPEALQALQDAGIREVYELRGGNWQPIPIGRD